MDNRVREIDGLRAVAVSLVAVAHACKGAAFRGGWVGVDLFFVLSGYLITTNLLREREKAGGVTLTSFYLRRAARLMPAAWVLLVFAAIAFLTVAPSHVALTSWLGTLFYFANFLYTNPHNDLTILAHTWSLSLEEQFYFVWPALFILASRSGQRRVFYVALGLFAASAVDCALMNLAGAPPQRTYAGFDSRSFELFLGCALAVTGTGSPRAQRLARLWPMPALFIAAIAISMAWKERVFPLGGFVLISLAAAWLITAVRNETGLAKALRWSPLAYLGEISYSVYLYHYPLVWIAYKWAPVAYRVPAAFLAIGLSIPLAALSYRWLESPIRQYARDRLTKLEDARRAAGAQIINRSAA